jgi:hypothetical protein
MRTQLKSGAGIVLILLCALCVFLVACDEEGQGNESREKAISSRNNTFESAEKSVPIPRTVNFPLRRALAKMTERQDLINHPWYVYILGDNGNVIGYYVSQTVPVNACAFLSSTEDVRDDDEGGNLVLTAPSLDGIFYGGAGAASGCDAWFFFDYATDALIQIRGVNFFSADQPLILTAEPIRVRQ